MTSKMMASALAIAATATLLLAGCTADDDTVEGKACVFGSNDPAEQCVAGYICVPHPDGARCERQNSNSLVSPLSQGMVPPSSGMLRAPDPNVLFLRRLGLEL